MPTIIGRYLDNHEFAAIGDTQRYRGVYVLGVSGTGKSSLLVSMIQQDIKSGHGVFFIDPHGDAITDLKHRCDLAGRENDIISLDPEDQSQSFAINPLACPDIHSDKERQDTYDRAYKLFERLWASENDFGVWLQSSIEHTLHVFIENQGYTLAEVPRFLMDAGFRNKLVSNIRHEYTTSQFWHDFAQKKEVDQLRFIEPLLTRLRPLVANRDVRHIIGQVASTINFTDFINDKRIVLARLSIALSPNVQRFIGTILVSDLMHAILKRGDLSKERRHQYSIYIDEVQNFTSHDDFAALFDEARKYGVATTIAHQHRAQFRDNKVMLGATDAAGTKVYFQLSGGDAQEQAITFEKRPPEETKRERQLVISQEPVPELLRGHNNQEICAFVNGYLRILNERQQDIKDDIEIQRLMGQDYRDEAALYQIYGRMEGAHERINISYSAIQHMLQKAEDALHKAKGQTAKVLYLFERGRGLRLAMRDINRFLTAVMEGKIAPGQEAFSNFLIDRIHDSPRVSRDEEWLVELYIALSYGDPKTPRAIPASLAAKCGLWPQDPVREELSAQHTLDRFAHHSTMYRKMGLAGDNPEALLKYLSSWKVRGPAQSMEYVHREQYIHGYLLFDRYRDVRQLLTPLLSSRFAKPWEEVFPRNQKHFYYTPRGSEYADSVSGDHIEQIIYAIFDWWKMWRERPSLEYFGEKEYFVNDLASFLRKYREGAVVACAVLKLGCGSLYVSFQQSERYPFVHALWLPAIEGLEPLEVLRLGKRINNLLVSYKTRFKEDLSSYFEHAPGENGREKFDEQKARNFGVDVRVLRATDLLEHKEGTRADADLILSALTKTPWKCPQPMLNAWSALDEMARVYLVLRACDIVMFGEEVANYTYPQPTIEGLSKTEVSALVAALVMFRRHVEIEEGETTESEALGKELVAFNEGSVSEYALPARVLTDSEITKLGNECSGKLKESSVRAVIDQFVRFCTLLSKPENYVMTVTAQYVEKQVPLRSPREMRDEMARELTELDPFIAYVRMVEFSGTGQRTIKGKIATFKLPEVLPEAVVSERDTIITANALRYGKARTLIEQEIRQRQERQLTVKSEKLSPRTSKVDEERREGAPAPAKSDEAPTLAVTSPGSPNKGKDGPPPRRVAVRMVNNAEVSPARQARGTSEGQEIPLTTFKELLATIARDELKRDESKEQLVWAARFALALNDNDAEKRILLKILNRQSQRPLEYEIAGLLALAIGETKRAEQIVMELNKKSGKEWHTNTWIAKIAIRLPDKTLARRLMHKFEAEKAESVALTIATSIDDIETSVRLMKQLAEERRIFGGIDIAVLVKAALYDQSIGKRVLRQMQNEKEDWYIARSGMLAAALGDTISTEKAFKFCIERGGHYNLYAGEIASASGNVTASEAIMSSTFKSNVTNFVSWDASCFELAGNLISRVANQNVSVAEKIWEYVWGVEFLGWYRCVTALRVLENLNHSYY